MDIECHRALSLYRVWWWWIIDCGLHEEKNVKGVISSAYCESNWPAGPRGEAGVWVFPLKAADQLRKR